MAQNDMRSLEGQVALVTGASSGIGQATAIELARAGADVVVNYRSDEDGARATLRDIEALGRRGAIVKADVSQEQEIVDLFAKGRDALGPIEIVFSNAGRQVDAPVAEMSLDDWRAVIDLNLTGAFLVGREAIRAFRARDGGSPSRARGKLVYNSSVHERIPWAFRANYAASKGGIKLLMESLAQEVSNEGIRVNSVAPGAIATAINAAEREGVKGEAMLKLIPSGRIGDPADIGRCVAWLVSDAADYIVGQTIFVDGGMTLYPEFRGEG